MKTLVIDHNNGYKSEYKLIEQPGNLPIAYNAQTSQQVVDALEKCRVNRTRIRIYLGDAATGRDWEESFDVTGYIGLSRGYEARFPILVHNARSMGGGSLLDHCIVKIETSAGANVIYQHPAYHKELPPTKTTIIE